MQSLGRARASCSHPSVAAAHFTAQTVGLRLTFVQPMPKVRGSAAKQMADAALPDTEQGTQAPLPQGSEQKEELPEEAKDVPERNKENDGEPKDDDGGEGPPLSESKTTQEGGDDTGQKEEAVRDEAERHEGLAEEDQGKKDNDDGDAEPDTPQVPEPGKAQEVGDGTGPKKGKGKGKKRKRGGEEEDEEEIDVTQKNKAASTYWLGLSREAGVSVQCVKKVHHAIRKIASRDLLDADIGCFTLHGIAKFTVKHVKYRQAYTTPFKAPIGKRINVSEREAYNKIYAKSMMGVRGLSD